MQQQHARRIRTVVWVFSVLRYWRGSREQLDSTFETGRVEDTRTHRDRV